MTRRRVLVCAMMPALLASCTPRPERPAPFPDAEAGRGTRPTPPRPGRSLRPATPGELCVTQGSFRDAPAARMLIACAKMRAVVRGSAGEVAELRFSYRGPSDEVVPLASGALRRQLGLKLRAQDTCNLVYVMWRIEPRNELVVSVKRNRGRSTHRQCGNEGYRTIGPRRSGSPPPLEQGGSHSLHAELAGEELAVKIDGQVVWQGDLGPDVRDLSGPVGLRTDNVQVEAELLSPLPPVAAHDAAMLDCAPGEGD
jgi:hypothetical protein